MIFPKINKIVISNFSLYKLNPEIVLDLDNGVFCLAGANGLGKSTFISILSYAISGIVVDPKINFASINLIPTYIKNNEKFALSYFKGRIDESKRDLATVYIEFTIDDFLYQIKRSFFDASGLISFSRTSLNTGEDTIDQTLTSYGLLLSYKDLFTKDVQLSTFEQFAFIQSFVLLFDERKKLIFWDEAVMNRVLYLFFGIDTQKADLADDLNKKVATHESNMRNLQWSITQNARALSELMNNKTIGNIEEFERVLEELKLKENDLNQLYEDLKNNKSEAKNCDLNYNDASLCISSLKKQYEKVFNEMYNVNIPIENDIIIVDLLRAISRRILNDEDAEAVFEKLKDRIKIVSKQLKAKSKDDNILTLKEIDNNISNKNNEINELLLLSDRLAKEQEIINKKITDNLSSIEKIKTENQKIIQLSTKVDISQIDKRIEALKSIINKDEIQKEKDTQLRDQYKITLNEIEKEIKVNYHSAEERFIPIFKGYATSFIGLDIDIELKTSNSGIKLVLKVNNTERTERFQLSESQQYFIDIALRFALLEYTNSSNAFIIIDTPEGSLDIAYESRAGKMFADFVIKGYDVIMTANINSSQLLLQMAKKSKKAKMKIERMTSWTILSKVQQEEQGVIEEAFNKIEEALND